MDVRATLLDTAERMFATNGVGSDSLRAIGRAAGVSSAAVLYHFATRQALVTAIVERRGVAMNQQMRRDLTDLIASEKAITARDVVEAVLRPFVAMIKADPQAGLSWMKVITQLANSQDAAWVALNAGEPSAADLFHAAAEKVLPDYESCAIQFRVGIAMYSMLGSLASADQGEPANKLGPAGLNPEFVEELARFTASGLTAD